MPWKPTVEDVSKHTLAAKTPDQRKLWANVANQVRKETGDEGRAVREANAAVRRFMRPGPMGLAMLALLVGLGACSSPVPMVNPRTGERADCGSHYSYGLYAFTAVDYERGCVADFRAQGWVRASR